jgi:two-component system, NarL family, sensor kinase
MARSLPHARLIIGVLCGFIFFIESIAPVQYIFGYLYIAPLLLSGFQMNSKSTSAIIRLVLLLTITDFAISVLLRADNFDTGRIPVYILVNKSNMLLVLLLTNWLLQRNFKCADSLSQQQKEINLHKAEISTQLRLFQMREDFVHTLTHDLKTPLLGAIQTIKYFKQEQFGAVNTLQIKVLDTMSQSQKRSLKLVETLLDVYRNDAEGLTLNLQIVDLWLIANEAIDAVEILSSEREIKLNLKCFQTTECPMEIEADSLQLIRVFINLLSNAIYHSPRLGSIDMIIHHHGHQYIIQVIDNGRGLNPTDVPLLFDRFYQAHNQARGSGLGLYLSRQIVEAHGGKIWAEPGILQGTKFCFSVPIGTVNNV